MVPAALHGYARWRIVAVSVRGTRPAWAGTPSGSRLHHQGRRPDEWGRQRYLAHVARHVESIRRWFAILWLSSLLMAPL